MKPDRRALSVAYLWLFSAGVDPKALDSNGETLAESLASLLAGEFRDGRREAAAKFLERTKSGEFPVEEQTGRYDARKLDELLEKNK